MAGNKMRENYGGRIRAGEIWRDKKGGKNTGSDKREGEKKAGKIRREGRRREGLPRKMAN